jgi:hypothetical protein
MDIDKSGEVGKCSPIHLDSFGPDETLHGFLLFWGSGVDWFQFGLVRTARVFNPLLKEFAGRLKLNGKKTKQTRIPKRLKLPTHNHLKETKKLNLGLRFQRSILFDSILGEFSIPVNFGSNIGGFYSIGGV